jgi:hypothetical protein
LDNFLDNNWRQLLPKPASSAAHPFAKEQFRPNGAMGTDVRWLTIAEAQVAEARQVAANARRGLARRGALATGRARALVAGLERQAPLVEKVAHQALQRIAGTVPDGSERVVSLHDPDARPFSAVRQPA